MVCMHRNKTARGMSHYALKGKIYIQTMIQRNDFFVTDYYVVASYAAIGPNS